MRIAFQLPERADDTYIAPEGETTTRYAEVRDCDGEYTNENGEVWPFISKCSGLDDVPYFELNFYDWVPMNRIERIRSPKKKSPAEEILDRGIQTIIPYPVLLRAPDPDLAVGGLITIEDGRHRTLYMNQIGCTYVFASITATLFLDDDRVNSEDFWRNLYRFTNWEEFRNLLELAMGA